MSGYTASPYIVLHSRFTYLSNLTQKKQQEKPRRRRDPVGGTETNRLQEYGHSVVEALEITSMDDRHEIDLLVTDVETETIVRVH